MAKDVSDHIRECAACQQAKATASLSHGMLQIFDPEGEYELWQVIHIDLVENFPSTSTGFRHLLSTTCRLTHATRFLPVKTKTASEAADVLIRNLFLQKGFP